MFCQNNKPEQIITPTESNKQRTSKNIFQRIEEGLQKLQETAFPDVNMNRFCGNGETFADTCTLNQTKFHKTCRNSKDNYHFERLKNNPQNIRKTTDNTKKIATRSPSSSPNFQSTCVLCDKSDGYLRISRTFDSD